MNKILKLAVAVVLSTIVMTIIKNFTDNWFRPFLLVKFGYNGTMTHEIASNVATTIAAIYAAIWALLFWLFIAFIDSLRNNAKKRQNSISQLSEYENNGINPEKNNHRVREKKDRSKYILIITGIILVLMLVYPPFHFVSSLREINLGYAFILNPPLKGKATINVSTLLAQCLVVTTAGFICFLAVRKRG